MLTERNIRLVLCSEDMMKVVKFGGSSLANAGQFAKVGKIIRSDEICDTERTWKAQF